MKKILIFIMAIFLMAPAAVEAKSKQEKLQEKEIKTKLKEYKKAGYTLFGSSRSMEMALSKHYDKLNSLGDDALEFSGVATKVKSKNVGQQMAMNNACINYARLAGSQVRGRVAVDIAGNGTDAMAEFDHFFAAYESSIDKEIRGEMQHSYSIIHDNGDGTYEIQSFFIVNEDSAAKARERAFENAQRESAAAQANAKKISEFVRGRVQE